MVYAQKSSALLITALAISAVTFAAPAQQRSKSRKHHHESTSMKQNMGNRNQESGMRNKQQLPSTPPTDLMENQGRAFDEVEMEQRDIDDLEERGLWRAGKAIGKSVGSATKTLGKGAWDAGKEILYRDLGDELHLRELDEDEIAMLQREFDDLEERGLWRAGKAIGKSVGSASKTLGKGAWDAGKEILYRDLGDELHLRELDEDEIMLQREFDDLEERGLWRAGKAIGKSVGSATKTLGKGAWDAGKEILYRDLGDDLHLRELDEDEIAMLQREFDDLEERGLWRAGKAVGKSVGSATKTLGKGAWDAGKEILYRDLENDEEMYSRDVEERSYDLDQLD